MNFEEEIRRKLARTRKLLEIDPFFSSTGDNVGEAKRPESDDFKPIRLKPQVEKSSFSFDESNPRNKDPLFSDYTISKFDDKPSWKDEFDDSRPSWKDKFDDSRPSWKDEFDDSRPSWKDEFDDSRPSWKDKFDDSRPSWKDKYKDFKHITGINPTPFDKARLKDELRLPDKFPSHSFYEIENYIPPKIGLTDEEVLRMFANQSLSPLRHATTQDARVVESGLKVVNNPLYVASEADALQRQLSLKRDSTFRAEERYDGHAVFKLSTMISGVSRVFGLRSLREVGYDNRSAEAELKLQLDKVNLCMFQVYETLRTGKVREAYVANVAGALETRQESNSLIENMLNKSDKFFRR